MINEGSLVVYKNKPAIVREHANGKYTISLQDGEQVKVRDKDIEVLHPGEVKDFSWITNSYIKNSAVCEVWELLSDEGVSITLKDLAAIIFNEYSPSSAYAVYNLLQDGLYFSGTLDVIIPKNKEEVSAEEAKRNALQRESSERKEFLQRLKTCIKKNQASAAEENFLPADDSRFIQDIEALAYGKTAKSRTLKELDITETPEEAHFILLKTGFWTSAVNPHPSRFGLSLAGASISLNPPLLDEERRDLCHLEAFAIDNSWSNDPDDAISIEVIDTEKTCLYVHIADPASSIAFDSPAEKEARDRGATLYLPEGTACMLADNSISLFALGLSDKSLALTFKIIIDNKGEVIDTDIFPSFVKVTRLTYAQADKEIDAKLRSFFDLSQKIFKRRTSCGAVNIELPDVYITCKNGIVQIEPDIPSRSASIVREFMLAAGEGAGTWAASRGLAFPYISQEAEFPQDHSKVIITGIAGAMQLRRCMRPRVLSVKPGRHQGLGLDTYTQVTSPLRRYTDLLAHIQIRTFLRGDKPLSADEISARLGYSEAAASATVYAERASNNHWIMVYLSDKKDSVWDAVAIENKGNRWSVMIPLLAMETQAALNKNVTPNEEIKLILKSVNIAKGEAVFVQG
ncbi:MAG: ribonuclease catalytic domain-containing protein [Treponema sp.]|nr:ribonuclease catalytic domain-containing protein [Treponema sp.]